METHVSDLCKAYDQYFILSVSIFFKKARGDQNSFV